MEGHTEASNNKEEDSRSRPCAKRMSDGSANGHPANVSNGSTSGSSANGSTSDNLPNMSNDGSTSDHPVNSSNEFSTNDQPPSVCNNGSASDRPANGSNNGSTRDHPEYSSNYGSMSSCPINIAINLSSSSQRPNSSNNAANVGNTSQRSRNQKYTLNVVKLGDTSHETISIEREVIKVSSSGDVQSSVGTSDMSNINGEPDASTFGTSESNNRPSGDYVLVPNPFDIPPDFFIAPRLPSSIERNSSSEDAHHQQTNNASLSGNPTNNTNSSPHSNDNLQGYYNVIYTIKYSKEDYLSRDNILLKKILPPEDWTEEGVQRMISQMYDEIKRLHPTHTPTIFKRRSLPPHNLSSDQLNTGHLHVVPIIIHPDISSIASTSGAHQTETDLNPSQTGSLSDGVPISTDYSQPTTSGTHQSAAIPSNDIEAISSHQPASPGEGTSSRNQDTTTSRSTSRAADPEEPSTGRIVFSTPTPKAMPYFESDKNRIVKYIPPLIPCEFCLRDIFLDAYAMCLPCGHLYCESCLVNVQTVVPVCSVCLKEFDPAKVIKTFLS